MKKVTAKKGTTPAKRKSPAKPKAVAPKKKGAADKPRRPWKTPGPVTPRADAAAKTTPASLEAHELANLLPEMHPSDFAALKADIAEHGQREPIVLLDGKILDGRHRNRACEELGLPPKTRTFDPAAEGSPVGYLYSKALHRNLNDGQKACAAARIEPHFAALAAERRAATLRQNAGAGDDGAATPGPIRDVEVKFGFDLDYLGDELTVDKRDGQFVICKYRNNPKRAGRTLRIQIDDLLSLAERPATVPEPVPAEPASGEAREQAASLFGVSGRYVSDAKLLLANAPERFERAFNGAVPLSQAVREYRRSIKTKRLDDAAANLPPVDPAACEVIVGDNLDRLPGLPRKQYRLIFEDGPYNIGIDYGKGAEHDARTEDDFLDDAEHRFEEYRDLLTPDGAVWVMINHEYAADYEQLLKGAGLTVRSWVTWHETFGNNCTNNFNRTSRRLFYCVLNPDRFVFNPEPFNRPSARQVLYNDGRAAPGGKLWDDVWSIPRLVDNAAERVPGVPTQLPLALVLPIVLGCTEPGDHVLDPFNGSGTTGHACLLSGRRFTGIERNADYAKLAKARWAAAAHAAAKGGKAS